jgi:uncharacterized Zn-binding protein involved in type VI secretion
MRSTTFEVLGMALMALITILTCGVMMTWVYLRETRGGRRQAARPGDTRPTHIRAEVSAAPRVSSGASPASEAGDRTDAPEARNSEDRRILAGQR